MQRARLARLRTRPLKQPTQDRSRATVEALLEATARVLVREGYARASTNRIAQVAGVNIASLYQYFPSKEALVATLIDRQLDDIRVAVTEAMTSHADAPPEEAMRAVVRAHLRLHSRNPRLQRALLREVPRVDRINPIATLRADVIAFSRQLMEQRRPDVAAADLDRAAFIAVHLVDALTQAALLERPEYLTDDAYADEIARLLFRYLRPDEA